MRFDLKKFVALCVFCGLACFFFAAVLTVYATVRDAVARGFEAKMAGVGAVAGELVRADDVRAIAALDGDTAKTSAVYLKYHRPMAAVAAETDSTFFYLFQYGGEEDIRYLVDAAPFDGEAWAAPNETEESVEADLKDGLFNVFRNRDGVSDIINTREWGYMRTGTYPLSDFGARSFYMAGVDVAVGEITTRLAGVLTQVGLVFAAISALALWAAAWSARAVSASATRLKDNLLRLGAGVDDALDARAVPPEFADVAAVVGHTLSSAQAALAAVASRREALAARTLERRLESALEDGDADVRLLRAGAVDFSGDALFCGGVWYAWGFGVSDASAEAILLRAGVAEKIRAGQWRDVADACAAFARFDGDGRPLDADSAVRARPLDGGGMEFLFANDFAFTRRKEGADA